MGAEKVLGRRYPSALVADYGCGNISDEWQIDRKYHWLTATVGVGETSEVGTVFTFTASGDDAQSLRQYTVPLNAKPVKVKVDVSHTSRLGLSVSWNELADCALDNGESGAWISPELS